MSVNATAPLLALLSAACFAAARRGPVRQELDWPVYLGTPRHDASATETLNPDPRLQWRVTPGRAIRGSPALGEAVLAVGTTDHDVVLIDRATGEVLWREGVDGSVRGGPLLDEDRLYVAIEGEPEGRVSALRLRDGEPLWRRAFPSVAAPLAFDGAALYAGAEDGTVARLDADSGRIVWRRALPGAVRAAPVPTPHGLAVATTADTLFLLDPTDGQVRARLATPGAVLGSPASDGERLYAGTVTGTVLAIQLSDFTVAWQHAAGDAVYGAPALAGDTLYVLARNGRLWLIPVHAPHDADSHALGIVATAGPTPLVTGVLVGSVEGEVLLVDRSTGAILWRAEVTGPVEEPPLVRDRQVVVASGQGNIQAYR
ncbi:MAG: PQQ-binding-like beta-propeller repeat protein [Gemmatimonadales bacterium]